MPYEFKIVVCASGGGGNFQALIDSRELLGVEIIRLIVDRHCGAINRALENEIPYTVLDEESQTNDLSIALDSAIPASADLVVLAGFMPIIPRSICEQWQGRMINTHPSLLPKYGGRGMYGVKVQKAVLLANEKMAGCTVHYVSPEVDCGKIILQKSIEVDSNETPWQLGGRIFQEENKLLVEAVRLLKLELE